jgi:DNA (cytosine-5)-methyltransferase 1
MQCDSAAAAYEFFAGGGMARLGLGPAWRVSFANDCDPEKAAAYAAAFGEAPHCADVWELATSVLPGHAALAWASFPCQDLSLAGARAGLRAPRSGAFWGFWRLVEDLARDGRAPGILALENVTGLLSSHQGRDFTALAEALARTGFFFGALEIDAAHFVPQSRPRVFIVAVRDRAPARLADPAPSPPFHTPRILAAARRLPPALAHRWVWWRIPPPPLRNTVLADVLDPDIKWNDQDTTTRLISLMSPHQRARLAEIGARGAPEVGALFRRVRMENGVKRQRAEARFDGLAGCLRTPAGGSSRQTILCVDGARIRSRLLTARECARLMGLPEEYPLPEPQTRALHLIGDGVAVPVVRWLADHLLSPLAGMRRERLAGAA